MRSTAQPGQRPQQSTGRPRRRMSQFPSSLQFTRLLYRSCARESSSSSNMQATQLCSRHAQAVRGQPWRPAAAAHQGRRALHLGRPGLAHHRLLHNPWHVANATDSTGAPAPEPEVGEASPAQARPGRQAAGGWASRDRRRAAARPC